MPSANPGGHLSSIRLPLVAGNWKMHMTNEQAKSYLARFLPALNELSRGQGGTTKQPDYTEGHDHERLTSL